MKHSLNLSAKYQYLFFDLDGTVIDPMQGITRSVAYALNHFGIVVNDLRELCPFIGPPLKDSFMEFYQFTEAQAEEAVKKYRERYSETGLYENEVYPGMAELLEQARRKGYQLMMATSKPDVFAGLILKHFHLDGYFSFVGGSGLDGSRYTKSDVIEYVIRENGITDLSKIVMIGDRKHDIIGAKAVGIDSIGVLYGYGDREELTTVGADYIVEDIAGLGELLLK